MQKYSKLNKELEVIDIVLVDASFSTEAKAIDYLTDLTGHSDWVKSEKEGRKNKGDKGFTFDREINGFISPKPFDSWTLNTVSCLWEAPITMPSNPDNFKDGHYSWNEELQLWELV